MAAAGRRREAFSQTGPGFLQSIVLKPEQTFGADDRILFEGAMIALSILAVNLIGDGLNEALNPRLRNRR